MGDGRQAPAAIVSLMKEREPVKKITQQKDKQGPFKYLSQDGSIAHGSKFLPGKAHGISNGKKKGREYQVGGCTAIPFGMLEGWIDLAPVSGIAWFIVGNILFYLKIFNFRE